MRYSLRFVSIALLFSCFFAGSAVAQGFGTSHKQVVLHRKLPPTAHLKPGSIKVEGDSPSQPDLARNLASTLQAELLKQDKGLSQDNEHPQTVIRVSVTSYSQPESQAVTVPSFQLGTKRPTTEQLTRIQSALTVAFEARETTPARTLDSDNITARYVGTFSPASSNSLGLLAATPGGMLATGVMAGFKHMKNTQSGVSDTPPTNGELQGKLIASAVTQIASHLVNTDEAVPVLLARGKLDDANKMADSGLWSKYLETLEQMAPLPSPQEDAYRLYNIGVGYEASAYTAEDTKVAVKFLDQAAINYGKAATAKPDERLFVEPQNRIETALAHYKKLEEQKVAAAAPPPDAAANASRSLGDKPAAAEASAPAAAPATTMASKVLNNEQVIALAKAGMDEDNLVDTIRTAAAVDFDLSVPGQLALTQAGVKGRVLTAMKLRARSPAQAKKK